MWRGAIPALPDHRAPKLADLLDVVRLESLPTGGDGIMGRESSPTDNFALRIQFLFKATRVS